MTLNLARLKELLLIATPRPWRLSAHPSRRLIVQDVEEKGPGTDIATASWHAEDAALIVEAINSLPAIIARLEQAQRIIENTAFCAEQMARHAEARGISELADQGRAIRSAAESWLRDWLAAGVK